MEQYRIIASCKKRFTLVELLVAMSVFSILLVLMMQFFSGSQKLWVSTEQKNDLYADARVAMDLMSTLLQGTFYASGGVPFIIQKDPNAPSGANALEYTQIYFPTQTQMDLIQDAGDVVFVSFRRGPASGSGTDSSVAGKENRTNELIMTIFADEKTNNLDEDFSFFFPPYGAGTITSLEVARNKIESILNKKIELDEDGTCPVLLDNVTAFKIIPIEKKLSETSKMEAVDINSSSYKKIPYAIEIQLSLMDKKNYDFWDKELKGRTNLTGDALKRANDFRLQHEHTFSRAIFLGDRWERDL